MNSILICFIFLFAYPHNVIRSIDLVATLVRFYIHLIRDIEK